MTNTELADTFLRSIGMVRQKGDSLAPIMPHFIMDAAYQMYNTEVRKLPLKHELKRISSEWLRNYNDFNRMFFSAFSLDVRDEIVDKMDDFEEFIANDIAILKCAMMDTVKGESFEMQMALGSIAICGLLCSAASCTWESIYHVKGHEVSNPSLAKCTKLMVKLLKRYYRGQKDYNMNTPATDAAVKSICYKIVQWIDRSDKDYGRDKIQSEID